jgi:hypothetical protein
MCGKETALEVLTEICSVRKRVVTTTEEKLLTAQCRLSERQDLNQYDNVYSLHCVGFIRVRLTGLLMYRHRLFGHRTCCSRGAMSSPIVITLRMVRANTCWSETACISQQSLKHV